MHLRHILVRQKFEAEDVQKLLKEGKDFAELARKWSVCASAPAGGDLGDLTGKKLNSDFAEAARILNLNQVSGVVRTSFGYHIIQRIK